MVVRNQKRKSIDIFLDFFKSCNESVFYVQHGDCLSSFTVEFHSDLFF